MVYLRTCFFLFSFLFAYQFAQAKNFSRINYLSSHHITEHTLKNGMRICLKQSDLEPGEFDLQLFAVGGYASLPVADQPSAWLAAQIAWESGLDELSRDELESALDNHSVEMNIKLRSFDREIEATGPISELIFCLHLSYLIFTNPQFNEAGLKDALFSARYQLQQKAKSVKLIDEEIFTKINMRNWHLITPFNMLDLHKVELIKAKKLFKHFFSNPKEFACIIVGDFNPQEVIPLLEETLGCLPASSFTQPFSLTPPPFFEGVTKKIFFGGTRYKISQTRLTFPLPTQNSDPIILELLCMILKQRILEEENLYRTWKKEIQISHRFPLFPYLDPSWLMIKFTSSSSEVSLIRESILKTLENIKQTGITQKEIRKAYLELVKNKPTPSDNSSELSLLADYYRAGWDILDLYPSPLDEKQEEKLIKKVLDFYPNLQHYSIISFHP